MRFKNLLILELTYRLILFILLTGCISPIDIKVENTGGQLVVSGQVTPIGERNEVQIGRTAEGRLPVPITGAIVQLIDDFNNSLYYYESKEGVYVGTQGIPGVTYHIQILLPNGETYESTPETMPAVASSVDVTHEFTEEAYTDLDGINQTRKFVKLYASTSLPPNWKERYINWTVEEVFILSPTDFPDPFGYTPPACFITQKADANRIALFDGTNSGITEIKNNLVCSRIIDRTFLEKHYFNTYQSIITREAYDYWQKVNILANQTGSIFDTPPAKIIGNIVNVNNPEEKVWGYFQATNETLHRFNLLPSDFPYPIFFPFGDCMYSDSRTLEYAPYCLDCLSVRNSNLIRPEWF